MLACTVRSISTYQKMDIDPLPIAIKGKRGQPHQFDPQDLVKWKVRQEIAKITDSSDGSVLNLEAERARLASEQADRVALENAIKRSDYAPIESLQFAIADFAGQAKSLFEGIPKRIKNSLPSLRAREVKILEREIIKVQNAVAGIQIDFDTAENG